jgi:hypothetical protein
MRNWDPLSIFKYLTGAPTMHLVMIINFMFTTPLVKDDSNAFNFDKKHKLIRNMWIAHSCSAFACFSLEMGIIERCLKIPQSIILPSVSLFIQIVCYQGLIFQELNFFFYEHLPYIKIDGEKGFFEDFSRWDVLIMLDIILFLSNLVVITCFLIGSVFPGEFISWGLTAKKPDRMEKTKDFMEDRLTVKKLLMQINTLTVANSVYLYLLYIDAYQKDMKI